ncbi:f-box domain-containing protein [Venturia nashicola]|uniref:F-box domain-containing protein n=1 Tax=Venturia nashicola TaxID=86259 RepID=A0A4Z1P2R6_9PEZI|nr:f-box domain-containing protein [Venturia nashicola]
MARGPESVPSTPLERGKQRSSAATLHPSLPQRSQEAGPDPNHRLLLPDPNLPPVRQNPAKPVPNGSSPIQKLADELLRDILDLIEADPDKGVNVDRRAYLSQESFRPPPVPSSTRAQDLGSWRRTCKRFSEVGAIHQFGKVTTRSSATWSPTSTSRVHSVAEALPPILPGNLDVQVFVGKVRDQKRIVSMKEDLVALKEGISAFTKLQHVQILPVQDMNDRTLISYIRQNDNLSDRVQLKWAPACFHSTKTVGEALIWSHSPCTRFSSPNVSPQSALNLAQPNSLVNLATQLTCIELHFDDGFELELDPFMKHLSPLFKTVFEAAKRLEAVHVGFPAHRPLTLNLEDLFHNVKWDKLIAFGIQGWKLDADEIKKLALRHRFTLKGLRLRDVLLKDGSLWKDVLGFLHDNMTRLDWVSLRRIGYAVQFDEQWANTGAEIPDDPPGGYSSESEMEFDDEHDNYSDQDDHAGPSNESIGDTSSLRSLSTQAEEQSDDEDRVAGDQVELPQLSPDTPTSPGHVAPKSIVMDIETAEDLGDNGYFVSNNTRKVWERWVVGRHQRRR